MTYKLTFNPYDPITQLTYIYYIEGMYACGMLDIAGDIAYYAISPNDDN